MGSMQSCDAYCVFHECEKSYMVTVGSLLNIGQFKQFAFFVRLKHLRFYHWKLSTVNILVAREWQPFCHWEIEIHGKTYNIQCHNIIQTDKIAIQLVSMWLPQARHINMLKHAHKLPWASALRLKCLDNARCRTDRILLCTAPRATPGIRVLDSGYYST